VGLAEGPADDREVLGEYEDLATVHGAVTYDDTLAGSLDLVHPELGAAVLDEGVELKEASGIEEGGYTLAGSAFPFFVLGGDAFGPAALEYLVPARLELA
jgi:hypothetical protein